MHSHMMFNCFVCSKTVGSYLLLKRHMSSVHSDHLGPFICKENSCFRSFNHLHSAYKHIKCHRDHKEFRGTENERVYEPIDSESVSLPVEQAVLPNTLRNFGLSLIEKKELEFVCKLYLKPHLTRNDVDDIINETKALRNDDSRQCFSKLDTEYKRFTFLKSLNLLVEPVTLSLGNICPSKPSNVAKIQFISIRKTLLNLFEIPGFLNEIESYMNVSSDNISDIKDGHLHQSHDHLGKLPLVLYFDDYETGNPLGSHKGVHKMGCIYFSLRCLPPYRYSSLQSIFLVSLFHSKLRETLGNSKVLSRLITELCDLETNGIMFREKCYKIYLAGVLGDNLGVNSLLGYVESFVANYCCRFCKASRDQIHFMSSEKAELMRDAGNYSQDLLKQDPSQTGIKEECVFNRIPSFHATRNFFVDVMHDICEGVANYDMCLVLQYYISNGVITLAHLNDRIHHFEFSKVNKSNRPCCITKLKLKKGNLSMSASEMHNFVLYFPLIIGDLVPLNCPVWSFVLCLQKILSLCSSKSLSLADSHYLETLIKEHHELYLKLFKQTLKPKHHFMVHYGRIIRESGPLAHNWSYRFESKHLESKLYAISCRSRINLSRSLALKCQLHSASSIFFANFDDCIEKGHCRPLNKEIRISYVKKHGIKISLGSIIILSVQEDYEFGRIVEIICEESCVFFVVKPLATTGYHDHYNAYSIEEASVPYVTIRFVDYMKPLMSVMLAGKKLVSLV